MLKSTRQWLMVLLVLTAVFALAACGNGNNENGAETDAPGATASPVAEKNWDIQAAGASFPNPLYQEMLAAYNKLHPNIKVNYQSIGSGGGQKQLTEGTIDFAGSDAFMSDEKVSAVKKGVVHVPMTIGAVAVIFNLDGVENKGLKLTQETLAGIYLGKIIKWNDPKLQADNAGVKLPDAAITVVSRSDGSGTTSIFTDYLSTISSEWKDSVGMGTSVKWPVGLGAKGNEGVAGQVKQTPNSIGYAELAYATENKINYALLRNKDGKFVEPSLAAASFAGAGAAKDMPKHTKVSIVEKSGEGAYGIVGFSWILLYAEYEDKEKKEVILDLVKWMYRDGQQYSEPLHYAKVAEEIAKINDENLASIK